MNNHRNDQPTNQSTELTKWIFWAKVFCVSKIKHRILWREKNQCAFGWQWIWWWEKKKRKSLKRIRIFFPFDNYCHSEKEKSTSSKNQGKGKAKNEKNCCWKMKLEFKPKMIGSTPAPARIIRYFFKKISDCSTNDVWIFFILEKFVAIFFL